MKSTEMRSMLLALAGGFAMLMPNGASAGLYQDDLSRCVLKSATGEDRDALLRWVFAAMATNPKIKDMANVSPAQAESLNKGTAQLMQRLLLKDCRQQAVDAIKYDGAGTIQQSFGLLGQIAMSDLMRDGSTAAYIQALDQYLDAGQWAALRAEAGIHTPPTGKP